MTRSNFRMEIVLVTRQRATVLQLPAQPKAADAAKPQTQAEPQTSAEDWQAVLS
jgi:hypothetical protein